MKTKIIALLFIVITISSCKKFDQLNINPNAPENVSPQLLLANILWQISNNNTKQSWLAGNLLSQQTANLEFLPVDRYDLGSNADYWNTLYHLLNDVKAMQKNATSNSAYNAVGMILKAWISSQLTDLWGDIPYYEATQGKSSDNFTPKFDTQKSIYTGTDGILDLLKKASIQLTNNTQIINGDILYNGNLAQWIKLSNSLIIRYLMRISKRVNVSSSLQTIVNNGLIFTANQNQASIPYLSSAPNQWFMFTERVGRYTDVRMSATSDSILNSLNDPRIGVYFKPTLSTTDSITPLYKGIPNGLSRQNQTNYNLSEISLLGKVFRDVPNGFDATIMSYSELEFALAEAVNKGFISGSASNYYQNGIQASFNYYRIALPTNYLTNTNVVLDGSDDLNRIMTQKWIALMMNGYESWFNIRRTGLPHLTIPTDNLNANIYPVRYNYPESEQAVNGINYANAVANMGGDTYNSKGWWEQ